LLRVGYRMPEVNTTVAPPGLTTPKQSTQRAWNWVFLVPFCALLWFESIHHLRGEWSFNPQYSYGWSVPVLIAFLLWRRWAFRPPAAPSSNRTKPIAVIVACAVLIFPLRFLSEANPDWRLLSWLVALNTVTASLALVYMAGGRPWLQWFGFPVAFFLVAVPWPTQLEQNIIQHLMYAVSAINVAFVNALGIPAIQHGNVIEVRAGLIGIEEACSGVRSLQATLMISLFLGELFSFRVAARCLLVAVGAMLAFACNLIRTALLVWIGATRGVDAIEGWHDPAGVTILIVCLIALWLCSLIVQRIPGAVAAPTPTAGLNASRAPTDYFSVLPGRTFFIGLALWLVATEVGVQTWYGLNESTIAQSRWNVQWPTNQTAYKNLPIPEGAANLLRYDEGGGASWDESGKPWIMFFFRWLPGRTAALFVKIHRPDVCLPASGLTMTRDNGIRLLKINSIALPIRSYRFDNHGTPLHVFYCYWDARSSYENEAAANEEDWSARGRWRAAVRGRREIGAQMLELVVFGVESDEEAEAALQQQLSEVIHSSGG
jgi:exosortase